MKQPRRLFAEPRKDDQSTHRHRLAIGVLGFVLPFLLPIISASRPTDGLSKWELLDSVSAYYYSGATVVFVGTLFALAMFLGTYKGYNTKDNWRDRTAATIACVAAIGVAFYPTAAPEELNPPTWWTPTTRTIHYVSAVVLFSSFVYFAIFRFTRSNPQRDGKISPEKRNRNRFYVVCGVGIVGCMLWAGSAMFTDAPIFWPESIALILFASAWLAKGHADWTAKSILSHAAYYTNKIVRGQGQPQSKMPKGKRKASVLRTRRT